MKCVFDYSKLFLIVTINLFSFLSVFQINSLFLIQDLRMCLIGSNSENGRFGRLEICV